MRHFDYRELDDACNCSICSLWRDSRAAYDTALAVVLGHARNCFCDGCKRMRRFRTAYRADLNRRDLYCELSYHAAGRPPTGDGVNPRPPAWGVHLMDWAKREITSPTRSVGWWETRAPYLPIASWLNKFTAAVGAVSGQIFGLVTSGAA